MLSALGDRQELCRCGRKAFQVEGLVSAKGRDLRVRGVRAGDEVL